MGASWSSLRWQNWAWDRVNVNTPTTRRPAQGQAANVCVVNVEETLAKSSLDLQIPGAVLLSSHAGVVHLLLPLPMAMIRWMEEWERVLLSHPRVSVSAAEWGWCIVIYCCCRSAANYYPLEQRGGRDLILFRRWCWGGRVIHGAWGKDTIWLSIVSAVVFAWNH